MGFQRVAKIEDLWSGEMLGVEANGEGILLVNVDNHIYAYADICPHQKSRLSEGALTGRTLRCARHHWDFDVCTGSGVNPRNACLKRFPVRIEGKDILVDTDEAARLGTSVRGEKEE
jgi:toluene monooxygenase system ferredoxin subunit